MNRYMDVGSFVVAFITLALFIAALFVKGFSHDLFLEAGVFLVSVKIIVMAYKNSLAVSRLDAKLDKIVAALDKKKERDASAAEDYQSRENPKD